MRKDFWVELKACHNLSFTSSNALHTAAKDFAFATLSSFPVLIIGFQLVQWEYVAVIQIDENLWH